MGLKLASMDIPSDLLDIFGMIGYMTWAMITKKLFIITMLISLVGHIAVLGLTGLMDSGSSIDNDTLFTLNLQEKNDFQERSIEQIVPFPAPSAEKTTDIADRRDQDTVNLDNRNSPYHRYLMTVKRKIRDRWSYPGKAYEVKEEGTAVVQFSIQNDGKLADSRIIISSGHESLDSESFHAVNSAAPFKPLPKQFNLTQLHIVARFQYALEG